MKNNQPVPKFYRVLSTISGIILIAAMLLMNIQTASAQTGWFFDVSCSGAVVDAPEHPDIDIRVQFKEPGATSWGNRQSWSFSAGGPATYELVFNPEPVSGSEYLIRVFLAGTNEAIAADKDIVECGPVVTETPPTPSETPPTPTTPPPSETPPTETPTEPVTPTTPPVTETVTLTPPTETPVTPTETVTPSVTTTVTTTITTTVTTTPTDGGSIPSETPTPEEPQKPEGTAVVLIPVTGMDTSMTYGFWQRTALNLGVAVFGFGLVIFGLFWGRRKK